MRQKKATGGLVASFFNTPLHLGSAESIVCLITDSSLSRLTPRIVKISLMHCEISPRFVADHQDKNESKLLHRIGQHRVLTGSLMTMVSLARQGNPSNGSIYISQERAVAMTNKTKQVYL
jgi:hypothetical protein